MQGIVGHDDPADSAQGKDLSDMGLDRLRDKKRPRFRQVRTGRGQAKRVEHRNHSAGCFGDRRVLHEQGLPDCVRLGLLGKRPVMLVSKLGGAEKLGLKIVVGQQFIDAPQSQPAESGRVQVGVHIDDLSGRQYVFDGGLDLVQSDRIGSAGCAVDARHFQRGRLHALRPSETWIPGVRSRDSHTHSGPAPAQS
jgi:hypothetical protein